MTLPEYQELISLTKAYLLQSIPKKREASVKAPLLIKEVTPLPEIKAAPVAAPPQLKKEEAPLELPKAKPPMESLNILGLIRTHCPLLKLIDAPQEDAIDALLLFDGLGEKEMQILFNLEYALKKAKYTVKLLASCELKEGHIQSDPPPLLIGGRSCFAKSTVIRAHGRKDPSGQVWIGKSKAYVIPSLAQLIEVPELRRTLWSDLLAHLKAD